MFYKVIKNDKVIDVLDQLVYLRWEPKHKTMILCGEDEAQVILNSGKDGFYHERTLYRVPVEGFDTVQLVEIDEYEYKQLKVLNMRSPEAIIDEYNLLLLETGVI